MGVRANGPSQYPAVSADGRFVAFSSRASNLVAGDANGKGDVFVHDRETGETTRVSVSSSGEEANGGSSSFTGIFAPSISADGRFIAFGSRASNLVAGDANGTIDVFVHDRETGETTRVSVSSSGQEAEGISGRPSISADGRFVAFISSASNLVAADTNGGDDVFVHDRQTGQTTRVSLTSDGTQALASDLVGVCSISADGRFVAFDSDAYDLVPHDTPNTADVFVHDRQTGQTIRVNVASDGTVANGLFSGGPSISADGRFVAFDSFATNLVPGDTNDIGDIFVHDLVSGRTARVSVASDGTQANASTDADVTISADGRFVAFRSLASTLVHGDTNRQWDIFVHDLTTGRTRRVSVSSGRAEANDASASPSISADGRFVAFPSVATNLVRRDRNRKADIFVRGPLFL